MIVCMLSSGHAYMDDKYQKLDTDHSPEFGSRNKLFSVAEVIGETTARFYVSKGPLVVLVFSAMRKGSFQPNLWVVMHLCVAYCLLGSDIHGQYGSP